MCCWDFLLAYMLLPSVLNKRDAGEYFMLGWLALSPLVIQVQLGSKIEAKRWSPLQFLAGSAEISENTGTSNSFGIKKVALTYQSSSHYKRKAQSCWGLLFNCWMQKCITVGSILSLFSPKFHSTFWVIKAFPHLLLKWLLLHVGLKPQTSEKEPQQ